MHSRQSRKTLKMMLKRIGIPDDKQKLEVVICLRQIIDLANYRKAIDQFTGPSAQ